MPELQEIKRTLSRIEQLEREVSLKQLQIKSLLAITQAINENVSAPGLFNMYNSFLRWEMAIRKMALYFKEEDTWECVSSLGIEEALLKNDVGEQLSQFRSKQGLSESTHPLFREFDLVIPVLHKEVPIAYAFIGGFGESTDDPYDKVQFVTTITNVIAVAIENKRLFKQQVNQEVVNRELEVAAEIQRALVPARLPSGNKYQLSSIYKPHFAVGGDYYDVVEFSDGQIAFCIADITGKGASAALLMANFQAMIQSLIFQYRDLETFVFALNQSVYRITKSDKYITFFVAEVDIKNKVLRYVNAGHFPPILKMNDQILRLDRGCSFIGAFEKLDNIKEECIQLTSDAMIVSFTDGLPDLRNSEEEYFGDSYLEIFVDENFNLTPDEFNSKLLKEIDDFRGDNEIADDIAVLTCKIY